MENANKTSLEEFLLLAFSGLGQLQTPLFVIILCMYIVCIGGNVAIIVLVRVEPSLHSPMYFFISLLAALDVMFVSCIIPKLLSNLIAANKRISFIGCFSQMFFSDSLGTAECYLLAVMAFDRDLAVNNPLHYFNIMNNELCVTLASLPWVVGIICVIIPTILTARLEFCGSNEVNHFFCDFAPLHSLACSDPFVSQVVSNSMAFLAAVVPFITTIGFYIHIIVIISRIHSSKGKFKVFSTCSSHLSVAGLYYITAIIVYVLPQGIQYEKFLALSYTVVTPLCNPFIYTFRNRDVKKALFRVTSCRVSSS
ncbi:hypothetical protein GDO86_016457 [Hymenochirus boettgeri]|uniref:G-protein coupled receptors family 1 profile domain-containing protein n=1 Tax=Hymenochirus boettgeri TaxID=247094 RepID=A0A8T2K352_9PIPI|nr:hypothetical protein GDO86_016457 [Hymenochirus boettgeri]